MVAGSDHIEGIFELIVPESIGDIWHFGDVSGGDNRVLVEGPGGAEKDNFFIIWELGDVLYVIEMIFGALLQLVEQVLEVEFLLALVVAITESRETQHND